MAFAVASPRLEPYYGTREIAEALGVTQQTVRQWLTSGIMQGVKMGGGTGRWRVSASALEAFKERHTSMAPAGWEA